MYLVNFQDILQSFVDLNLSVKVKNVQQLEHLLQENDELLNIEYHVQVFYSIENKKVRINNQRFFLYLLNIFNPAR